MNDLDKALTVLSTAYNALQTEAREKEDVLDKTSNYVTVLERDNKKLQEVLVFRPISLWEKVRNRILNTKRGNLKLKSACIN